jgi:hypothetical protein
MSWCCGQIRQRDLARTAPVGRDQPAVLEWRAPAASAVTELDPQRAVVEPLHGSPGRRLQVRLLVDPVEGFGQGIGLHREEFEQESNRVFLRPVKRHASPHSRKGPSITQTEP